MLLVFPCSTLTSFKLYSLFFGINLFCTVTVIVFPETAISAPVCGLVITAFCIPYILPDNAFVTCTWIGSVIIFSYPSGAFVSSIVIVSVPVPVILISLNVNSPFAFVVSVSTPFGDVILNSAPSSFVEGLFWSTFINFSI